MIPTRTYTYQGETLTTNEWAERTGIPYFTLAARLKHGWSIERALTQPLGRQGIKRSRSRPQSLAASLPALRAYQRDMHAAHRQMSRSLRQMMRAMNQQVVDFQREIDDRMNAQIEQANRAVLATHTRGVGESISKSASDRTTPVAQETV